MTSSASDGVMRGRIEGSERGGSCRSRAARTSGRCGLAAAIISESGLSYLGFGVQPPTPTWGNLLRNAQSQMTVAPWTAIFPGLMIFVVVLAVNFLGEGLRDALDPRHVQK